MQLLPVSELPLSVGDKIYFEDESGKAIGEVSRIFSSKIWAKIGSRTIKGIEKAKLVHIDSTVGVFHPDDSVEDFIPPAPLPTAPAPAPEPEEEPEQEPEIVTVTEIIFDDKPLAIQGKIIPLSFPELDDGIPKEISFHPLEAILADKRCTAGELLKFWHRIKPQMKHGVAFPPTTKDDLIRAILKRLIMAPESVSSLVCAFPLILQRWPYFGWFPWLSHRQNFIVCGLSKMMPIASPEPIPRNEAIIFDYGFALVPGELNWRLQCAADCFGEDILISRLSSSLASRRDFQEFLQAQIGFLGIQWLEDLPQPSEEDRRGTKSMQAMDFFRGTAADFGLAKSAI